MCWNNMNYENELQELNRSACGSGCGSSWNNSCGGWNSGCGCSWNNSGCGRSTGFVCFPISSLREQSTESEWWNGGSSCPSCSGCNSGCGCNRA